MASVNTRKKIYTHEGARAKQVNPEMQLRRSVLACMLWENNFYEDGMDIAKRIQNLVPQVHPNKVAALAIEAREHMHLRHAPLLLVRELARNTLIPRIGPLVCNVLSHVIQRADELTEFLAIYWKDGKEPLSGQVKKGLAKAFGKFDAYQLAKYNRKGSVKLRDVLRLCHPKPKDKEQEALWRKLLDGTLESPDTWEVALSSGGDKKEHWERLLKESKLGALALIRNIRNMQSVGVDEGLLNESIMNANYSRVLPFRFIAAARHAPNLQEVLEGCMLKGLEGKEKLPGKTALMVDVSGSMDQQLSRKSDVSRLDAACGLAILLREICESINIYTFSREVVNVPNWRGFALQNVIGRSQPHGGTYLGAAVDGVYEHHKHNKIDRLIVITDEQSHDRVPDPKGLAYMINVSNMKNGVGYGPWNHIDGWSESVVDYIVERERFWEANEAKRDQKISYKIEQNTE